MAKQENELYEFGPFRVDPKERLILRDGRPLSLTPKAFETLLVLLQNNGHLMLKDELMKVLWPDSFVEEVNLSQNISMLRRVLGDTAQASRYIVTVPGKGYRFVAEVKTLGLGGSNGHDDLVVESRSRSRIVIREEVVDDDVMEDELPPPTTLDSDGLRALPGSVAESRWGWRSIVLTVLAGAVVGAFLLWMFVYSLPAPRVLRSMRLTHSGRVSPYSSALTDGSRIYFTETSGGTSRLAQIPMAGGESMPVTTSVPSVSLLDIDATQSKLLLASQGPDVSSPLWAVPTAGGSAQRLGDAIGSDSAWSPDGQQIAYSNRGEIYIAAADGSRAHRLASLSGIIEHLRWSPEGKRLRFNVVSLVDSGRSLWEANAETGVSHPLDLGWKNFPHSWGEGEYNGDWTPDGRYFVFRSLRGPSQSFWAIREKRDWRRWSANAPVEIFSSPDRLGEPRFTPDAKKLLFVGLREQRELVTYDSSRHQFVPYMGGIPARLLNFSPDGQWVVYKSETDGALWRSRIDGTGKLQLTFPPMRPLHSSWSPEGKTIVFQASAPGESAKLYTVPFTGGKPEILLQDQGASLAAPSWCGDGSAIFFMQWSSDKGGGRASGVAVLNLKTHERQSLPGTVGFDGIHCSPDGRYAAAGDIVNHKLMLFDRSSQRWSLLTEGTPYGWGIRWSADSKYVYYQHADDEEEQPISRVRISDRKAEQITSSRQILRADVLSYTMTGLTPDNSPLASLVRRNSDVYALELELP